MRMDSALCADGTAMPSCPYRGCHGDYAHPSPHLFEAPQIENMEESAARSEQKAVLKIYYNGITREEIIKLFEERNKRLWGSDDA